MTDLREKIVEELEARAREIEDATTAYERGQRRETEPAGFVADRIIALLPKAPALRWDDESQFLYLGKMFVGYVGEAGEEYWCGYIVSDDIGGTDDVINGAVSREAARAAVERAVREALGWEA